MLPEGNVCLALQTATGPDRQPGESGVTQLAVICYGTSRNSSLMGAFCQHVAARRRKDVRRRRLLPFWVAHLDGGKKSRLAAGLTP
jgi:hypothetical protein